MLLFFSLLDHLGDLHLDLVPLLVSRVSHVDNLVHFVPLLSQLCLKFAIQVLKYDLFFPQVVNLRPHTFVLTNCLIKLLVCLLESVLEHFSLFCLKLCIIEWICVLFICRCSRNTSRLTLCPLDVGDLFLDLIHFSVQLFLNLHFFVYSLFKLFKFSFTAELGSSVFFGIRCGTCLFLGLTFMNHVFAKCLVFIL